MSLRLRFAEIKMYAGVEFKSVSLESVDNLSFLVLTFKIPWESCKIVIPNDLVLRCCAQQLLSS